MELNTILARVRKLTALAEHSGTPEDEARAARSMADALMLRYAIDEAQLDKGKDASARSKPGTLDIQLTGDFEMLGYVADLASSCARHCRCQIRHYYGGYHDNTYWSRVYGFESDLRYFEIMYTTLRLHMLGAFRVTPDPVKSYQLNCYELHKGGLNWLDIAIAYGWREVRPEPGESRSGMYVNKDGDRYPWSKVIAPIKRAYAAEIARRGEEAIHIPPGGMHTFRRSAAQGYTRRIAQRLREVREHRNTTGGAEIVLRGREDDLSAFFKAENPDLFVTYEYETMPLCEKCARNKTGSCRDHPRGRSYKPAPFSSAGYSSGVNHANRASLNPEASTNKTREIS